MEVSVDALCAVPPIYFLNIISNTISCSPELQLVRLSSIITCVKTQHAQIAAVCL